MLMRSTDRCALFSSRNILLRRLSRSDQDLLGPYVEEVSFPRGHALIRADEILDALYFPNSGVLSVEERVSRRDNIEVAVVGREGLLGWPALLGCERSGHSAIVQGQDATALRINLDQVLEACHSSPTLQRLLLSFVQTIITQMGRTIASHLDHTLGQNLARWLLMRHDRVGGDQLMIRHEEIAGALGVRRPSITVNLHVLEGDRLIRCNRGRMFIRDRAGLERVAGEAYGCPEDQYRSIIGPFGKSLPGSSSNPTVLVQPPLASTAASANRAVGELGARLVPTPARQMMIAG